MVRTNWRPLLTCPPPPPDGASTEEADQWTSDEDLSSPAAASHAPAHSLSSEAEDDVGGISLDSEEDHGRKEAEDGYEDLFYDDDDDDDDYEKTYDDEGEEVHIIDYVGRYRGEEKEGEDRFKRKVIFGGGGGYGGVHRSGRGGGGDPYGRRRDNPNYHGPGPDYGNYGSWPYGRGEYVDTSSFDRDANTETTTTTSTSTAAPTRSAKSRAYGIVRSSPGDGTVPSSSGRKSKTGRRETKRKLSKDLKWEIAQYALQHGTRQAVHHYSQQVGKRISEKKIDKFVRRYQQRQEREESRQN